MKSKPFLQFPFIWDRYRDWEYYIKFNDSLKLEIANICHGNSNVATKFIQCNAYPRIKLYHRAGISTNVVDQLDDENYGNYLIRTVELCEQEIDRCIALVQNLELAFELRFR